MQNVIWWCAIFGLAFSTGVRLYSTTGGLESKVKPSTPWIRLGALVLSVPPLCACWYIVLKAKP